MHFLFLSKVPVNEPPQGSPAGPLWRELPVYRTSLHISHSSLKISLNKEIFPFSQRPWERRVPPCSPKAGPLWKQTPISRALLSISFGSPVKEPSLQVHLIELIGERCPTSRAFLYSSFQVPGIRTPFQVPQRSPYGESCPSPESSFTHPPGSPVKKPPLPPRKSTWQGSSFSACHEMPHFSFNPNFHYRIHKNPPLLPILSQINPSNPSQSYFLNLNFKIILWPMPGSSDWPLSLGFLHQNPLCFLRSVQHTLPISFFVIW